VITFATGRQRGEEQGFNLFVAIPVSTDLPCIGDEAAGRFSDPLQVKGLNMSPDLVQNACICPVMLIKVITEDNVKLVQQVQ
jgi:hypothetical protein